MLSCGALKGTEGIRSDSQARYIGDADKGLSPHGGKAGQGAEHVKTDSCGQLAVARARRDKVAAWYKQRESDDCFRAVTHPDTRLTALVHTLGRG